MKKGFTLVELLAVITILGIIAVITMSALFNVLSKSKEDSSKVQKNTIVESAKKWAVENEDILSQKFGSTSGSCCITIDQLIDDHYITSKAANDPKTGEKFTGSILVTRVYDDTSDYYSYEYQDAACDNSCK